LHYFSETDSNNNVTPPRPLPPKKYEAERETLTVLSETDDDSEIELPLAKEDQPILVSNKIIWEKIDKRLENLLLPRHRQPQSTCIRTLTNGRAETTTWLRSPSA
jgi:hypothetical protein